MQRLLSISLMLSFLSLPFAGCARYQDRPINPADSKVRIEKRALSSPKLREFIEGAVGHADAWPFKTWDMDRLTLAAIYYHPDLALARAQAETANAAIKTAGQRPNPSFTLSPTWVRNLVTAAAPWIVATYFYIPIETAGKRGFRLDKSRHLTDAARLRVADAAWLVRSRLRLAMLEVYAAQEAERLLQQQLGLQQAMTRRLDQQRSAGEITRYEATRSHLALNQLQLNVSAARKRTAESQVMLAAAIGMPVDALSGIELDFRQFSKPPETDRLSIRNLKEIALRKRPDVLSTLSDYEAAQSALQLEIANQYPNIQANPGYTWELGEHRWMLGGTVLQLPIMHQNQGPIAEAEAKRHELAVRFEGLQLRILGDIDRAHTSVTAVLAKWFDAERQKRIQKENLNSAEALFQAGETDRSALLGAELESAMAERARLDVLVETQLALSGLEDTLRYPMSSHLTATLISDSSMRKTPE